MSTGASQRFTQHFDGPNSPARVARTLASRLAGMPEPKAVRAPGFVRLEMPVDGADILSWLRAAPAGARRYFRDRSARLEVAGVGVAHRADFGAHDLVEQRSPVGAAQRASVWFVAMPFDGARPREDAWRPFADDHCVLPIVEFRRDGESHALAVNLVDDDGARGAAIALLERLAEASTECAIEPPLVRESDGDGEAAWTRSVRGGLDAIARGELRKIVLARTRRYHASGALDPVAVLVRLAAREVRGFRFLVEAGDGHAFLGVTPERLVSRSGRTARSEAVAGTRPRGVDAVADKLLGESLLASPKDRREHELVIERVREALAAHASSLRVESEPRLRRLAYVQHLVTRVVADLRPGTRDAELVVALHPTPAVAGAPVPRAIAALRELESFDRGLYAGPVGVVSRDGAEIAVAIRSARIDGDSLTAYAGAGIVDGSDPSDEWRETGHKLLAFERLAT